MLGHDADERSTMRAGAALMLGAAIISAFIGGGGVFSDGAPLVMGPEWFYVIQLAAFPTLGAAVGIIYADRRRALENEKYRGILCFCCMTVASFLQLPLLFGTRDIVGINAPAAAVGASLFGAAAAFFAALYFARLSRGAMIAVFVYFIYELYFTMACIILLINSIYVV